MTKLEESYIHFVTSIGNLNEAWRILQIIKQNEDNPLVGPAFQFALIEYSKPYLNSRGVVVANHMLGIKHIPAQYRGLHKELLAARQKIYAHSDLTVDDARVYVTKSDYGKHVGILRNVGYDTEKLSETDDIINLIEKSLDNMYIEVKRREAALPFTS